jgi:eukaryotic-like serine/threonine-protein kinase
VTAVTHPYEEPPATEYEEEGEGEGGEYKGPQEHDGREARGDHDRSEVHDGHGGHGEHRGRPEYDATPPPTEHEEPPPLTEHEEPPPAGVTEATGPTEDEMPAAASAQAAHGGRDLRGDAGALPASLRARFRLLAVLRRPEQPHQAGVYRVRDDRGTHILKWYHRGHGPDRRVWELLSDRPRRHLTHFTETEDTGADGHPYDLAPSYGETDLARYLKDNPGPVDPALIHALVRQLHEALTTLHELDVVHRDISPANIVLGSLDPAAPDLVLVDFGVSAYEPGRALGRHGPLHVPAGLAAQPAHPPARRLVVPRDARR